VTRLITTASDLGNDDVIKILSGGTNFVIGGTGSDRITIGDGTSSVFGDEAVMYFDQGKRVQFMTLNSGVGARDYITTGSGYNTIVGGTGSDVIDSGNGTNHVFGDEAVFNYNVFGNVSNARSLNPFIAGNDEIVVGFAINVIVGGSGSDLVRTGSGWHTVFGDNADLTWDGVYIRHAESSSVNQGGNDRIIIGGGFSLVFGGRGLDYISDSVGHSFLAGDNGYATLTNGRVHRLVTNNYASGSDDTILGGQGQDTIFGGTGSDFIDGGGNDDVIVGDQGRYGYNNGRQGGIVLMDETHGGDDTILGGGGQDLIYGEGGNDFIDGEGGDDTIFAGHGDDTLLGGDDQDILVGGPGYDFLDGGANHDILYVDVFDTWAGGLPEDTIIGGPFHSTDSQLNFGLPALGYLSDLTEGGSAAASLARAFAALREGEAQALLVSLINAGDASGLLLLDSSLDEAALVTHHDLLRWGSLGEGYLLLALRELSLPQLISIGQFLEVQWSELMVLMGE
jgi:Ca2+-binding RTX toxin-like protein